MTDVVIKAGIDLSQADRAFQAFGKRIRKPMQAKVQMAGGTEQNKQYFNKGASIADQGTSGTDQFIRGGFYESLRDKAEAVKNAKDMFAKKKAAQNERGGPMSDVLQGPGSPAPGNIKTLTVASATFMKSNFTGGGPGGPGSGEHKGPAQTGNTMNAAGSALPYVGIALAIAGGIMKSISALGEKYTSTMMSQSGTIGALGGYRGGGGGYFANAEVAQASLAYTRTRNDQTQGAAQSRYLTGDDMQFASSQGMGLAQFGESIGEIQRTWKDASLTVVRQYAASSKLGIMKEGEFVQQLGAYSKSMRDAGYKTEGSITGALGFISSLAQTSNSPERGMSNFQALDKSSRGADKGGVVGNVSLMLAMQKYGDVDQAMQAVEKGEFTQGSTSFIRKNAGKVGSGFALRDTLGNYTEGANLTGESVGPGQARDLSRTGGIQALAMENRYQESIASSPAAAEAAKIGYDAAAEMLKMFNANQPILTSIATGIHKLEMGTFKYVGDQITTLTAGIEALQKGEFGEAIKILGRQAFDGTGPGMLLKVLGQ